LGIYEDLGLSRPLGEVLRTSALALATILYVYTIGSFLNLTIYSLQNRVVYDTPFRYLISEHFDHLAICFITLLWLALTLKTKKTRILAFTIYGGLFLVSVLTLNDELLGIIALSSAPLILAMHMVGRKNKNIHLIDKKLYVNYFLIVLLSFGLFSLLSSMRLAVLGDFESRDFAYDLFLIASSVSSVYVIILVLGFPLKQVYEEIITALQKMRKGTIRQSGSTLRIDNTINTSTRPFVAAFVSKHQAKRRKRHRIVYLLLFMALSSALSLIPHLPSLNKDDRIVGVDTLYYESWVKDMFAEGREGGITQFFNEAWLTAGNNGDRPISLLIISFITALFSSQDIATTIDYLPLILSPLLVLAVFFFTKELTENDVTSLLAAFLTCVSSQILVGIFAGFYANWLALIFGYTSFAFLFRFLKQVTIKKEEVFNVSMFWLFLVLCLFAHVYTWTVLTLVMSVYLLVVLKFGRFARRWIFFLLILISSTVIADVIKSTITGTSAGVATDIYLSGTAIGPAHFSERWNNLVTSIQLAYGGVVGNAIILLLALYWLFKSNYREESTILLVIFLSIGIIPLFVGGWVLQSRILYDIPFQIIAAMALARFFTTPINLTRLLVAIVPCLWLTSVAVKSLSNFYLILP
jgi:hypothetical protein